MNTSPNFERIKQINILGREYWSARDLMEVLGYDYWQNFEKVIKKAMKAAASPEINLTLTDHFSDVTKMVTIGSGAKRKVKDYFLSKRACYLIAQNGDPGKPEIALAQNYLAFTAKVYDMQQARLEQEQRLGYLIMRGVRIWALVDCGKIVHLREPEHQARLVYFSRRSPTTV
jgi:hypothetical protein